MPNSLLVDPCKGIGAGNSVGTLAKGYVVNTSCLEQHKRLLEGQRKYKESVEVLYGKP